MISQKRIQLTKLALALSIALSATPSFAQNTTSAVGGRVTAADGKPAAGAQVSIVHTESGSVNNVVADAEGRYVARGLRAGGPYTIIVTKDGVTDKHEGVFLNLAETAQVDASLGTPIQTVTVAGKAARSEIFSKSSMGSGTAISPTELQAQASIQRNLQDYARMDPRVSQTDKERGEMSVGGQNSRYNSLTIDGVAVNDTFGLEANGSPTAKQPISIEAIQSVQVNVANYDVTQKGYTGANINAVTKSGTNNWKGSVYYVFRNDKLAGDRYNASNDTFFAPPTFEEKTKGFTVGGPLIQDKLFLFANMEELRSSRSAPAYGPIGSANTNVGISTDLISQLQSVAQSRYGIDVGTLQVPEGTELVVRDRLLKLDWNINDNHRLMVRWSKTDQNEPIFPNFSDNALSLSSWWYNQGKSIETMVGQLFSDWTPSFSTEFKVSSRDYDSVPVNNARLPAMALQVSGPNPVGTASNVPTSNRFLDFGTELSRQNNVLRTRTKDVYLGANWSKGDHEIKFGMDYNKNDIYNAFLQNVFGNYTFGCINSSATLSYTFGAVNCGTADAATIQKAILENYSRGRPLNYQVQVPVTGGSLTNAIARFTLYDEGFFAQDTWSVNNNLTVNAGVRLDRNLVGSRPLKNDTVQGAYVPGNAATGARATGGFGMNNQQVPDDTKLWQPRFGFNYKLSSERLMQVRGGFGLFQGAAMSVWMSNAFSNPGVATRVVGCGTSGFPACPPTDGIFSPNPDAQPTSFPGSTPAANVDLLDPSFKQPSILKANLAFDTELPWYGLTFTAEYLYTKNKDSIYYKNLNLGDPTRTGTDGRALYYTPQAYNPACWTATGGTVTSGVCSGFRAKALSNANFNNVLLATNSDQGKGSIFTLQLSKPLSKGFGWSVSTTHTKATEVSPLTSSTSSSNYAGRSVFNPNEDVAANSAYLVKDRINANLTWQKKFFGEYKTSLGIFYEGRSGKPYSWTINNDLNGDGLAGNDLMYIPKAFGSGEVTFRGDTATDHTNEQKFWDIVNADEELHDAVGRVTKRGEAFAPWTNSFDMRISQEIPGFMAGQKGTFTLDFLNVGNLLNKRWGRIPEVGFQSNGGQARSFVDYGGLDANGHYIYIVRNVETVNLRQTKGESQWAIQATVKYEF